jgi:hypothetical protein
MEDGMPTEQQLVESVRALAADHVETFGREGGIAADVLRGVRAHHRRRVVLGAAAAVAVVSVASYAGIHAVANTSATPATDHTSDGAVAHTMLPPSVLDLRGKSVGEALGLPALTDTASDCGGTVAAYAPGHGFCVDIGNAPDDWLVSELIMDSDRTSGLLRSAGIPWESDRPAPPPVVVGFLEAKVVTLSGTYGEGGAEVSRAKANLAVARSLWTNESGWDTAGWNDDYWGDPWWPTDD